VRETNFKGGGTAGTRKDIGGKKGKTAILRRKKWGDTENGGRTDVKKKKSRCAHVLAGRGTNKNCKRTVQKGRGGLDSRVTTVVPVKNVVEGEDQFDGLTAWTK